MPGGKRNCQLCLFLTFLPHLFFEVPIVAMDSSQESTANVFENSNSNPRVQVQRALQSALNNENGIPIFVTASRPLFIMEKGDTIHVPNNFDGDNPRAEFKDRLFNAIQGGVLNGIYSGLGNIIAVLIVQSLVLSINKGLPHFFNRVDTLKSEVDTSKNDQTDNEMRKAAILKMYSDMIEKNCTRIRDEETAQRCEKLTSQFREMLLLQSTKFKEHLSKNCANSI